MVIQSQKSVSFLVIVYAVWITISSITFGIVKWLAIRICSTAGWCWRAADAPTASWSWDSCQPIMVISHYWLMMIHVSGDISLVLVDDDPRQFFLFSSAHTGLPNSIRRVLTRRLAFATLPCSFSYIGLHRRTIDIRFDTDSFFQFWVHHSTSQYQAQQSVRFRNVWTGKIKIS